MKSVYTARHGADAYLVLNVLMSQGIAAEVRGEFLAQGVGELPAGACQVWVCNDSEVAAAEILLRDYFSGAAARRHAHDAWRCPQCDERHEGQFTTCWHCGTPRPALPPN